MSKLGSLVRENYGGGSDAPFVWSDADTIKTPDGQLYRLESIDAPEIVRFDQDGVADPDRKATAGANIASIAAQRAALENGYTDIVPVLNEDGSPKMDATGSRPIIRLHNAEGRDYASEAIRSGMFKPTRFSSDDERALHDWAEFTGAESDFDQASVAVQSAIAAETGELRARPTAINEEQYSYGGYSSNLAFRKYDRTLNNKSLNPMSDSWEQGWIGAEEGAYGFLELLGDTTGIEKLAESGEIGVYRARAQQEEYADILTDWKDVNGINSGVSYLVNNAAMSLPYMVTTAAAGVAGAAVGAVSAPVLGTAVAVGIPSLVYAGQTWNEMEGEKNAGVALTAGVIQGALDRVGVGALVGMKPKDMGFAAVSKIMTSKGMPREAAEQYLAEATKQEIADVVRASGEAAVAKVAAKQAGVNFLKSASREGVTEVMQEATGYVSASIGSDKEFEWEELNQRMIAAAIAGSALGGAFSVPGSVVDGAKYHGLMGDTEIADHTTAVKSAIWAEQEIKENGYIPSNKENLAEIHAEMKAGDFGTLDEYSDLWRTAEKEKSTAQRVWDKLSNLPALWQGSTRNLFSDSILERSRTARIAADLFGGNPDRVFSGDSFEDAKHHKVATYKNFMTRPEEMFYQLNGNKPFTQSDKKRVSAKLYDVMKKAVDKDGNFDAELVPKDLDSREAYIKVAKELNALSEKMYADQKVHNPELGYVKNYLHTFKSLDKQAVLKKRTQFQSLLQSEYGMTAAEADQIAGAIVDDPNVGTVEEAFSVVSGGIVPGSHKKRTLNLAQKEKFAEFMEQDLFANVSHATKSAARYVAHREYIGQNGKVITTMLDRMSREGLSAAEIGRIASGLKDYLDAESGTYNRPTSEFGKKAEAIQKHAMMLMTFAGLPLAVFSSFVEAALIARGVDGAGLKVIKSFSKDFAEGMVNYMNDFALTAQGKTSYRNDTAAEARIRDAGYYEWDVGAATTTGVSEVHARHANYYKAFFKANGLTQWTDYTRALRASFAGDFLNDNMELIMNQRRAGTPYTREVQEAELKLRNLGLDIDRFSPIYEMVGANIKLSDEQQMYYDDSVRTLTYGFVNDAIVLPQASNRPLMYQDPRFALFMQFQGFISTFTTKVLPKLWRDAFGNSTPTMMYSAWATMMTMIMLAFVSQAMKDWIKYDTFDEGDDEYPSKTAGNPYLNTPEYIRRGVLSTGLLGISERAINTVFPLYAQRSDNPGDWLYNQAVGESPALGYVQRVAGASYALASGDVGKGVEQGLKAAPVFGPFNLANRKIGNYASDWNFNGE